MHQLCRAKCKDNGEWVEGFYVCLNDTEHRIYTGYASKEYDVDSSDPCLLKPDFYEIDPATLSWRTGMQDKNGKDIYTNDVVRFTYDAPDDPLATENGLRVRYGRIFFMDWRGSIAVTDGKRGSMYPNTDVFHYTECRYHKVFEYTRFSNTVEIIGNVFDNPEILENYCGCGQAEE